MDFLYRILLLCFLISGSLTLFAGKIETDVDPLKDVYKNDFTIGCLLSYRHVGFSTDPYVAGQSAVIEPNGGYLIQYHMNSMSPGNNMKTAYTVDVNGSAAAYKTATNQSEKDSIDKYPKVKFNGDLIAQLNWAKRQGFTFRGHTLVWHASAPAAFFRTGYTESGERVSPEVMLVRMENYIKEVIRQLHENWPGLLSAMDVVNETVADNGSFRTSNNEWYSTFGDQSYVFKAFEFARKYSIEYGETQMKLYYNDYNTDNSAKANFIVKVCQPIYDAGLLDGIGMQEHSSLNFPKAAEFIASYNKFDKVCNEMAITELDISTKSGTNFPSNDILLKQANQYSSLFKCFVERSYKSGRGKIINVSKDGLNDQYTFVTNQSSSLWDANNLCKPAFFAVVEVGQYYNRLDTLIAYAETMKQGGFSDENWSTFQDDRSDAKNALSKNYSENESAVDGLYEAIVNLESSIIKLQNSPTTYDDIISENEITMCIKNGNIELNNIPEKGRIQVYGLSGSLLNSFDLNSNYLQIPYISPCIIRINAGDKVKVFKAFSLN